MSDYTTQSLAMAALAHLPLQSGVPTNIATAMPRADHSFFDAIQTASSPESHSHNKPWHQPHTSKDAAIPVPKAQGEQTTEPGSIVATYPTHITPLPEALPLPSLLKYVDNDLLRRRFEHNNPPQGFEFCTACGKLHRAATVPSTYLPLTCGCWMHYRCFIAHVVRPHANLRGWHNDCCPNCGTRLFIREGIVALTLATRTDVLMPDTKFASYQSYTDVLTGLRIVSDNTAYQSDCMVIQSLIQKHFLDLFTPGAPASRYRDGSPDLTACYYTVLGSLGSHGCPKGKWLSFSRTDVRGTSVGFFLFGMLVALKMRGFLMEYHAAIVETEGWADFENAREELQGRILGDVKGHGWSWAITAPTSGLSYQYFGTPR